VFRFRLLFRSNARQFLISLRKTNASAKVEVPLITFTGTQRETGEVLVDGEGAMELTATERGGLRRMDLKETSPYLRALTHSTLHAAFRYQKRPAEMPAVALEWVRFPESKVLSAVAQEAVVTTLVTSEGRSLTEIKLTLKNQAQPFLKVALPTGASILSAEVAGEKVKPVLGADGSRVPLLRPGFRPTESYNVSFVFVHAGVPFEKKGGAELSLPKMDIPIGVLQWEVYLPDRYKLADFGGDAISARLIPPPGEDASEGPAQAPAMAGYIDLGSLGNGQIGGDCRCGWRGDPARTGKDLAPDDWCDPANLYRFRWPLGSRQRSFGAFARNGVSGRFQGYGARARSRRKSRIAVQYGDAGRRRCSVVERHGIAASRRRSTTDRHDGAACG